jgi:hypothetical protein
MPPALDLATVWPGLPGSGCVEFTEGAGQRQGELIVPFGQALPDRTGSLSNSLAFNVLDETLAGLLVDAIELDSDNLLIDVPDMRLYEGQLGLAMVRDVVVDTEALADRFRTFLFSFDPTLTEVETGIALAMAPILGTDDSIQLELRPQVAAVGFPDGPIVDDGANTGLIELPAVEFRQTRTSLLVRDGQTVVLGGVRLSGSDPVIPGIPLLSEVPVVGPLFPLLSQFDPDRALIVLITPRLIPVM